MLENKLQKQEEGGLCSKKLNTDCDGTKMMNSRSTVNVYLVGSPLLRSWLFDPAVVDIEHLEIVGESNNADSAGVEILRLKPQVVLHAAEECAGDSFLLLQNIKLKLSETQYIVVGNISDAVFRFRYLSSCANLVLDRQNGPEKIIKLLSRMISDLDRARGLARRDHLRVVNNSSNQPAWDKLFSLMDESSDSLMFADHDFVLRHINPAVSVAFESLEEFLPGKIERLVGKRVDTFHRKLSLVKTIISDPRNLPYYTQIIIGPKVFDLKVRSVYDEGNKNRVGIIAQWTELPGILD